MEKLTLISESSSEDDYRLAFWARLWALYGFEPTIDAPFLWPMTLDMKRALLSRILDAHNDPLGRRADLRLWNEAAITSLLQDKVAQYQLRQVVAKSEPPETQLEIKSGKKRGRPPDDRAGRAYSIMNLARASGAKTWPEAANIAYQLDPSVAPDSRNGGRRVEALVRQREDFAQEVQLAEGARLAHLPIWEDSFKRRLLSESDENKESFRRMFALWDAVAERCKQDPGARTYHILNFWEWASCEIPPKYIDELISNLMPVKDQQIISGFISQKILESRKTAKVTQRPLFHEPGTKTKNISP